jgi:hypothetical protein
MSEDITLCAPGSVRPAVRPAGLEPATACLEGRCSIQLSYGRPPHPRANQAYGTVPSASGQVHDVGALSLGAMDDARAEPPPSLAIERTADDAVGDPACWAALLCPNCGAVPDSQPGRSGAQRCGRCGIAFPLNE